MIRPIDRFPTAISKKTTGLLVLVFDMRINVKMYDVMKSCKTKYDNKVSPSDNIL